MNRSWLLWLALAVCSVHMAEESIFGFPVWASLHGLSCSWMDFHVMNVVFLLFGFSAAVLGWRLPSYSLGFPALLLGNAVFHSGSSLLFGSWSPGTLTSVVLFVPVAIACFAAARRDGVAGTRTLVLAGALGLAVHVFPAVLQILRPVASYGS